MKSVIVKKEEKKGIEYPCLMIYEDILVFFHKKDCGMIVNGGGSRLLGDYSEMWDSMKFKPFNGSVTLSND